ncbi:MAG TPA: hypothetical protein VGM10_28325 [Actinocrinis sp.]|jgi:hypothetical protein
MIAVHVGTDRIQLALELVSATVALAKAESAGADRDKRAAAAVK